MSIWECLRVPKTYHESLKQVKKEEKKTKANKKIKKTPNKQIIETQNPKPKQQQQKIKREKLIILKPY